MSVRNNSRSKWKLWRLTSIRYMKSKGLGDSIEKFTTATGIKKVVDTVTQGGCGCNDRKDTLNRMFPYKK